jgi:hypothetical protein
VTYVDNASIEANPATPEPGSLVMLGSGLVAVAGAIRRKFVSLTKETSLISIARYLFNKVIASYRPPPLEIR